MNVPPPTAYGPNADPQAQTSTKVAQAGMFAGLMSAAVNFITGGSSGEYIAGVATGKIPGDMTEKNLKDADRAIKAAGLDSQKLEKIAREQKWDQGAKINFIKFAASLGDGLENGRLPAATVKDWINGYLNPDNSAI